MKRPLFIKDNLDNASEVCCLYENSKLFNFLLKKGQRRKPHSPTIIEFDLCQKEDVSNLHVSATASVHFLEQRLSRYPMGCVFGIDT